MTVEPTAKADVARLTDKEIELREWLRSQPGGGERWTIVKAGFRRSYDMGMRDSLNTPPDSEKDAGLTTARAVEMVAYERAPRGNGRTVNLPIICADGFTVSVQASHMHYAHDSSGKAPYWQLGTPEVAYPFTTFEIGYPSEDPPPDVWDEYDSGGVWAWVPSQLVADLLDLHGGAVGWQRPSDVSHGGSHA